MKIIPRRFFLFIVVVFASAGRTDAQLIQNFLDFLNTLDYAALLSSLCPVINPVFEGFGFSLPFCTTDSPTAPTGPAPAPKTPKKITSTVSTPVAPPAATP